VLYDIYFLRYSVRENFEYLDTENRKYCRGTAAHNTMMVDNKEQAEIWKVHRIGRRGYPLKPVINKNNEIVELVTGHTGYKYLHGSPIVKRSIKCGEFIEVIDQLETKSLYNCSSFIHLAPEVKIESMEAKLIITLEDIKISISSSVSPKIIEGLYCPEFGVKIKTQVVRFDYSKKLKYIIKI